MRAGQSSSSSHTGRIQRWANSMASSVMSIWPSGWSAVCANQKVSSGITNMTSRRRSGDPANSGLSGACNSTLSTESKLDRNARDATTPRSSSRTMESEVLWGHHVQPAIPPFPIDLALDCVSTRTPRRSRVPRRKGSVRARCASNAIMPWGIPRTRPKLISCLGEDFGLCVSQSAHRLTQRSPIHVSPVTRRLHMMPIPKA